MVKLLNNKGSVSVPIAIFVLMMIVLIVSSGFYFSIRNKNLGAVLDTSLVMSDFNTQVDFLNYHLQRVFDKAVEGSGGSKEGFIQVYLVELEKYRLGDECFIEGNLYCPDPSNVEIVDGKFVLELDVEVVREGDLSIEYTYKKRFFG